MDTTLNSESRNTLVEAESKYEHDLASASPITVHFDWENASGTTSFELLENGIRRARISAAQPFGSGSLSYTPKLPGVVQLTVKMVSEGSTVASSETLNVRIYGTAMDPALDDEALPYTSAIYLHADALVKSDTVAKTEFWAAVDRRHTGAPIGGSFTLTLNGETTAAIPADADETAVQQALENVPSVGAGNVVVAKMSPPTSLPGSKFRTFIVQFRGSLAHTPRTLMTGDGSNLSYELAPAGTVQTLSVYRVQAGSATPTELNEVQVVCLVGEQGLITTDSNAPYALLWSPETTLNDASFPFRSDSSVEIFARAITAKGAVSASDPIAIYAIPAIPSPQGVLTVEINASNLQELPGNNRIVAATTPVKLTAEAKDAAGIGRIVQSVQFFLDGVALAPVSAAFPYQADWTPKIAGTYVLTAIAIDDKNNRIVSAPMFINVTDNRPYVRIVNPMAAAGSPLTIPSGAEITFTAITAGATGDPATTGVIFSVDGQPINGTGAGGIFTATWSPANIGATPKSYQISASVSDSNSTTNISDTAFVTVLPQTFVGASPSVSVQFPTAGGITSNSLVNLAAFANDSDGEVVAVRFYANGVPLGFATRDQQSSSWRLAYQVGRYGLGDYSIVAQAIDNVGNSKVSSPAVRVTVTESTAVAPTVMLAASTREVTQGGSVVLSATAAVAGTVAQVEYFANGISLGVMLSAGPMTWTPSTPANYSVYAVVTDQSGNVAVSPAVTVSVQAGYSVATNEAFVSQTYQDLVGRVPTSAELAAAAQISGGTLTRAQFVANVVSGGGFAYTFQATLAYRAVIGDWPGYSDYLAGAAALSTGTTLADFTGTLLSSAAYLARNGSLPDLTTVTSGQYARVSAFASQLYQRTYGRAPTLIEVQAFLSDINTLGVNAAVANFLTTKFITQSDAGVTARVRAAALVAGLWREGASDAQVAALSSGSTTAAADSALANAIYTARFFTVSVFPASAAIAPGGGLILTAEVSGASSFSYQWYRNGVPLAGAVQPALSLSAMSAAQTGNYHVVVANQELSVASAAVRVTMGGTASRLANISTRGRVAAGDQVMIVGFVVSGGTAKPMLVRAAGPALASAAGLAGTLSASQLELRTGNTLLGANQRWGENANLSALVTASTVTGAFAFAGGSADSALLQTLDAGVYTGVAGGVNGESGLALVEVYDGDIANGGRVMNLSTRGFVGGGAQQLIAGFVVTGAAAKQVLIRAVGPGLAVAGGFVNGMVRDPRLELVAVSGLPLRTNDDWGSAPEAALMPAAAARVGAFPLATGSADAALIANLAPGVYTVLVSGASASDTGLALVEVYDLDP
ncbi:hypothetical protein K0B96_05190 [Horticoccus luteus]|uniref:Ig-like domain-containing protein n=1 Tax=Horticoccus luteus TaxID=2862869 RepID=A0A8F9TXM6_9BACT|nr:Ig-like domain-containing protein [Horticoccus luteus]QYM80015.1 hypothetical protein K0B96_05190 [Horticoccus luteus]